MIRVFSGNLLVREGRGARTFDPAELQDLLEESCLQAGMQESWLAEHVARAVEEHLSSVCGDETPPTRAEIDHWVTDVLVSAGYSDVAAVYGRKRELTVPSIPTLAGWDQERVRRVLQQRLPLDDQRREPLAARVHRALEQLGIPQVSDDFIRQLACHLWAQASADQPRAPETGPWLVADAEFPGLFTPADCHWLGQGPVRILPVSRLLPQVQAVLSLPSLAGAVTDGPLTELAFFPALDRGLQRLQPLIAQVHTVVEQRSPQFCRPPLLTVRGVETLIRTRFQPGASGRYPRALAQEIKERIQAEVRRGPVPVTRVRAEG